MSKLMKFCRQTYGSQFDKHWEPGGTEGQHNYNWRRAALREGDKLQRL